MTRADDDDLQNGSFLWGPLLDALKDDTLDDKEEHSPAWKTLIDAVCWVACIFASVTASLYLLMIVLFGEPSHHLGIFTLGCLATITGYACSFGIMACSPGRGPAWLFPSVLLFWLSWWTLSLPEARGFIH